jgi:hypothetical protein
MVSGREHGLAQWEASDFPEWFNGSSHKKIFLKTTLID